MSNFLFTSEAVACGHPDKVADQISDAVVDACITQDPTSRVACETVVTAGLVFLTGEITTTAHLDLMAIARETIRNIGYTDSSLGFDYKSCGVLQAINRQSPDIAQGVSEGSGLFDEQGAGDQGLVFGFACKETPEMMPLPHIFSHRLLNELRRLRESGEFPYLCPDGKSQTTVEYSEDYTPQRLHTVVLSAQHTDDVSHAQVKKDLEELIRRLSPEGMIDDETLFYINPTGRFVVGGPLADAGLTGRKPIVDTYGGMGRHGGGAFSGKDPTKVDRSGAYAARYAAKNVVAAGLATRCELQISYAIGVPWPISIKVDCFGTAAVPESLLAEAIPKVFNLSPKGIIEMLDLLRPIYLATAYGGHFGRSEESFTWEKTDRIEALKEAISQKR